MKITLNIKTGHVLIILLFVIAASAIGLVAGYGGTTPSTMGHTWGEINCPGCITSANIQAGTITTANIASIDGGKITGTVPNATNADTVDGKHAAAIATWAGPCNPVWGDCQDIYGTGYCTTGLQYCTYMGMNLAVGGTTVCLISTTGTGSCGSQSCTTYCPSGGSTS